VCVMKVERLLMGKVIIVARLFKSFPAKVAEKFEKIGHLRVHLRCKTRVSTEINFVGISIGIPIEINLEYRRNYWSKLSKVIGISISISTVEIEIRIRNRNRIFDFWR
jgi:hypothetical protein